MFRQLFEKITNVDEETEQLLKFVGALTEQQGGAVRIVDVACGYGRTLKRLQERGLEALGVEVNEDIVAKNKERGLRCVNPTEFEKMSGTYDIVVMSHIVEHFPPRELKEFIDSYLDYLRPGGHLIVATPLLSDYFFDDFDHVKPYSPAGLLMVFGEQSAQVQYRSRHVLELQDLWFRRSYFRFVLNRGRYLKSWSTKATQAAHLVSALVFLASCRIIGRKDGWMGVFRKVQ